MFRRPILVVLLAAALAAMAGTAIAYPTAGYTIWRVAGDGFACSSGACDNASATKGRFNTPTSVVVDSTGNAYIADRNANRIRKLTPAGALSTFAGNGTACGAPTGTCGDGPTATAAQLTTPTALGIDSANNIFIADSGDHKIRKVTPAGAISTVVGSGTVCAAPANSCGDAGPPASAQLNNPQGVAVDGSGNIYISDTNDNRIRKVLVGGTPTITAPAGDGPFCTPATTTCGDGPSPGTANLSLPAGLALDGAGNLYVADTAD